jgi:hypothetical protein
MFVTAYAHFLTILEKKECLHDIYQGEVYEEVFNKKDSPSA